MYSYICSCIYSTTFFCKKEMKMEPFSLHFFPRSIFLSSLTPFGRNCVWKKTKIFKNSTLSGPSETMMIFRRFQPALKFSTVIDHNTYFILFPTSRICPRNDDNIYYFTWGSLLNDVTPICDVLKDQHPQA